MLHKLFNSIVFHIGAMLFAISCVSIISMFSSVFISELADKDALAINHAGSMRMQSYRILSAMALLEGHHKSELQQVAKINQSVRIFSQKLIAPVLSQPQNNTTDEELNRIYTDIKTIWKDQIHPLILSMLNQPDSISPQQMAKLETEIDSFVVKIDRMVFLYQQHAESRITAIRMIQGIALFVTFILVAITLFQLSRRVEKPLSELTRAAKQIMAGDYTAETDITQNDELGLLSSTMNKMSLAISQSHSQLEKRVREKTTELRHSNDSLQLLYQIAQLINQSKDQLNLEPIVKQLSQITHINDLDLCLMTSKGNAPYEHIISSNKMLPSQCIEGDCGDCINVSTTCGHNKDKMEIKYPLLKEKNNYGVLVCHLQTGQSLASWQHQLFSSVAEQIATGLSLRQQNEQNRRLSLLTERNTIARELHDSLAQALSYLKIQVSRLQKLREKPDTEQQIDEVVIELKNGLSTAYRELRELLTTFRLKIDNDGLETAFKQTVAQLNDRAGDEMQFDLDYDIRALPLTPNEEIHLMQIAREATQNALHHSKGNNTKITVFADQHKLIHLIVEDNGIGMPDDPQKLNHYGLAILQERSAKLNGSISFDEGQEGGVRVELVFQPDYVSGIKALS